MARSGFPIVPSCSTASMPGPPSAVLASLAALTRSARDGLGGAPFAIPRGRRTTESHMLRICDVILDALRDLRPVLAQIEAHDPSLGKPLRRCATSMALNTPEGAGCRGGGRPDAAGTPPPRG